jgi:toxin ParE1/3/4
MKPIELAPEAREEALGLRRALLSRFPYGVVFVELEDHIRVVAIAHAKRKPGYWLHRVVG